jgi:hypothetical protein
MSGTPPVRWVQRRFDAQLQIRGRVEPASIELTFDGRSPWAIGVVLASGDVILRRDLLRKMLDRGLRGRVASHGVCVWISPLGRVTPEVLHLCYPDDAGQREWTTAVQPVCRFLGVTYRLVPRGRESAAVDLDVEFAKLLGGRD